MRHIMKKAPLILFLIISLIVRAATESKSENNKGSCVSGNCVNGEGTFIYIDGKKYEGHWESGKRNGKGILNYPDDSKFEGLFKDGIPNGQGIETDFDGHVKRRDIWKMKNYSQARRPS
jgi:Uncharacterized protein conserved in bacteria